MRMPKETFHYTPRGRRDIGYPRKTCEVQAMTRYLLCSEVKKKNKTK
jgi:hypothetical protein